MHNQKLLSAFLFLCIVAPIGITYSLLQCEKYQVKKTIKWRMIAGMDKSGLVLLKFSKEEAETQLEWEHSREFEYKGRMYDVVEKSVHGDTIWYRCWPDDEETKLNLQLNELVASAMGKNPVSKDSRDRLNNFLKSLYCSDHSDKNLLANNAKEISPFHFSSDYSSFCFSPPTPPPEIA